MTLASCYVEGGIHDFSDYATLMIDDLGTNITPYLLSFWEVIRAWEYYDTYDMTAAVDSKELYEELLVEQSHLK